MVNSVKEELLVTRREDKILFARVQDGKIVQLQAEDSDGGILGNIYVAKVRNIVKILMRLLSSLPKDRWVIFL